MVISGHTDIDYKKFKNVEGKMKDKLKSTEAQKNVMVADLDEIGVGDVAEYPIIGADSVIKTPIIIFDGEIMHLSRWPNSIYSSEWPTFYCAPKQEGYQGTNPGNEEYDDAKAFTVQYDDSVTKEAADWSVNLNEIIAEGYWKYDWYSAARYVTLNKEKNQITAREDRNTQYGVMRKEHRTFRFWNVYEELDEPGEWYIDRADKKLYIYPLTNNPDAKIEMSRSNFDLISMNNTSYVTLYGIEVAGGQQNGVVINGGTTM